MLRVIRVRGRRGVLGGRAGGVGEPAVRLALALHGGAGDIPADTPLIGAVKPPKSANGTASATPSTSVPASDDNEWI